METKNPFEVAKIILEVLNQTSFSLKDKKFIAKGVYDYLVSQKVEEKQNQDNDEMPF